MPPMRRHRHPAGKCIVRALPHRMTAAVRLRGAQEDAVVTYSVVARDPESGAFGVAVQSHYFSVGAVVPWVEAGVGAVATQAFAELSYGPLGLERMRAATPRPQRSGHSSPPTRARRRQVAMVDNDGAPPRTPASSASHHAGASQRRGLVGAGEHDAQPDRARRDGRGLRRHAGRPARPPARRARCGRSRGRRRSRATVGCDRRVVDRPDARVSAGTVLRLHVEDHERPLDELRRLVRAPRYELLDATFARVQAGDFDGLVPALERALELAPASSEIRFRLGGLARDVRRSARPADARRAVRREPGLARADPRLVCVGRESPTCPAIAELLRRAGS